MGAIRILLEIVSWKNFFEWYVNKELKLEIQMLWFISFLKNRSKSSKVTYPFVNSTTFRDILRSKKLAFFLFSSRILIMNQINSVNWKKNLTKTQKSCWFLFNLTAWFFYCHWIAFNNSQVKETVRFQNTMFTSICNHNELQNETNLGFVFFDFNVFILLATILWQKTSSWDKNWYVITTYTFNYSFKLGENIDEPSLKYPIQF